MSLVWLDAQAREAIAEEAARRRLKETGGGLFGYVVEDEVVVARALPPGPRAQHRRTRLVPHPDDVQEEIECVFDESDGRWCYLGDWHTHPMGAARPSGTDSRSAQEMASDEAVEVPEPLVLIQATKPLRVHVGIADLNAFRWSPADRRLVPQALEIRTLAV